MKLSIDIFNDKIQILPNPSLKGRHCLSIIKVTSLNIYLNLILLTSRISRYFKTTQFKNIILLAVSVDSYILQQKKEKRILFAFCVIDKGYHVTAI